MPLMREKPKGINYLMSIWAASNHEEYSSNVLSFNNAHEKHSVTKDILYSDNISAHNNQIEEEDLADKS